MRQKIQRKIAYKFVFIFVFLVIAILNFSLVISESGFKSELKVTLEHPFYVNNSWIEAKDLKIGDILTLANGKRAEIKSIKEVENETEVYNFHVDNPNTYFANDVLVHNKPQGYNPNIPSWEEEFGDIVFSHEVNKIAKLDEHITIKRSGEYVPDTFFEEVVDISPTYTAINSEDFDRIVNLLAKVPQYDYFVRINNPFLIMDVRTPKDAIKMIDDFAKKHCLVRKNIISYKERTESQMIQAIVEIREKWVEVPDDFVEKAIEAEMELLAERGIDEPYILEYYNAKDELVLSIRADIYWNLDQIDYSFIPASQPAREEIIFIISKYLETNGRHQKPHFIIEYLKYYLDRIEDSDRPLILRAHLNKPNIHAIFGDWDFPGVGRL